MVKRWGEARLVVIGAFVLVASLLVLPSSGRCGGTGGSPACSRLLRRQLICHALSDLSGLEERRGNEQGGVMGATQSAASLARTLGPLGAAF